MVLSPWALDDSSRPEGRVQYQLVKFYLKHVVPAVTRLVRRSPEAEKLMRYYWDTIETCVPPAEILAALETAGFSDVKRHVLNGMFSEYVAVKSGSVKSGAVKSGAVEPGAAA